MIRYNFVLKKKKKRRRYNSAPNLKKSQRKSSLEYEYIYVREFQLSQMIFAILGDSNQVGLATIF